MSDALLMELQAIRAAIEALPKAIAVAVRDELLEPAPEESAPVGCQHPTDKRVDLGDGDWDCGIRGCNYQHREAPVGATA